MYNHLKMWLACTSPIVTVIVTVTTYKHLEIRHCVKENS